MGFYIRKTVQFGPLHFNISKSGVGVSFGTTGTRLATGPRGTYIHLGRKGATYRRRLDGLLFGASSEQGFASKDRPIRDSRSQFVPADFFPSSGRLTVAEINQRIQQPAYAGKILAALIIVELVLLSVLISTGASLLRDLLILIAVLGWILGMAITWVTNEQESVAQKTTLEYDLDEEATEEYGSFLDALRLLAKSQFIWQVTDSVHTSDWKKHAGATSLVDRNIVKFGLSSPPFIVTTIDVYGLMLGGIEIFFLPDQLLIYNNRQYRSLSYTELKIDSISVTFREIGVLPSDAEVVDYTWRYVRRDGGPDMRFSGNFRVPIVLYWLLHLYSLSDLSVRLHVSNAAYAQQFAYAISSYILFHQMTKKASTKRTSSRGSKSSSYSQSRTQDQSRTRGGHSSHSRQQSQDKARQETRKETSGTTDPYIVLQVSPNAQWEEVAAAYRRLVQMYHPDKVTGLAPEYQEIAERRMKEINAAYSELKRRNRR